MRRLYLTFKGNIVITSIKSGAMTFVPSIMERILIIALRDIGGISKSLEDKKKYGYLISLEKLSF